MSPILAGNNHRVRILVAAKAGDPLLMAGRARLIWAANTADALTSSTCSAWLTGHETRVTSLFSNPKRVDEQVPDDGFRQFYGTSAGFRIVPSRFPRLARYLEMVCTQGGHWEAHVFLPRWVFPRVSAVHTRDFRLASRAVRCGIPTIYEDHNESFHQQVGQYPSRIVNNPAFRLAVAPTATVREMMVARGIPEAKTMVAWSGLNRQSLRRVRRQEIEFIRSRFLINGRRKLATYCGGLHACRGIEFLLQLAALHQDVAFVVLGGRPQQMQGLRAQCAAKGLRNVSVLGYRPQVEIPAYLQASDLALMPYKDPREARITCPLKFFEYTASGTPFVAARIPELRGFFQRKDLAIDWCDIGDFHSFRLAFENRLRRPAPAREVVANHIREAARHTWNRRQESIMGRAGLAGLPAKEEDSVFEDFTGIFEHAAAPLPAT